MNKTFLNILVTIFIAVSVHLLWPQPSPTQNKPLQESTFERIKRTGIVRCGFTAWAPFWEVDPNTNQSKGVTKELSDKLFEFAGWKPVYIPVASGNEVQDLQSGKIDIMCGAGPWAIGTLKEIDYAHPYYYGPIYLYSRSDETRFHDKQSINRQTTRFVGMDGDLSIDLVQRSFPQAQIQSLSGTTDPSQMLLNVATHKADLVLMDPISVRNFNQTNDTKLKALFPEKPVAVYGGGFAIRKGQPDFLETVNGLSDMMNNLNIPEQLIEKYGMTDQGLLLPAKNYQPAD